MQLVVLVQKARYDYLKRLSAEELLIREIKIGLYAKVHALAS